MYDYNARYYSAVLGRFVSPDSIVPEPGSSGGFNRYRYTRNNPLKYTDPSGHCAWDLCIAEGIAIYYVAAALVVAAGAVIVTSDPYQEMARDAGQFIDQGIKDLFEQVEVPTDSGGYGNSTDSQSPAYEEVPLSEPGDLALPNVPPQVGPTAPPGFSLEEPGAFGDGVLQSTADSTIYRGGRPSPSNLKPRPQDEGNLSFRDSLSNPWPLPEGQRPPLPVGKPYFGVNTSKLPPGSVIYDNDPPGHVSVRDVPPEVIKDAIIERGNFPK